jgi:hypothetical protein
MEDDIGVWDAFAKVGLPYAAKLVSFRVSKDHDMIYLERIDT